MRRVRGESRAAVLQGQGGEGRAALHGGRISRGISRRRARCEGRAGGVGAGQLSQSPELPPGGRSRPSLPGTRHYTLGTPAASPQSASVRHTAYATRHSTDNGPAYNVQHKGPRRTDSVSFPSDCRPAGRLWAPNIIASALRYIFFTSFYTVFIILKHFLI